MLKQTYFPESTWRSRGQARKGLFKQWTSVP